MITLLKNGKEENSYQPRVDTSACCPFGKRTSISHLTKDETNYPNTQLIRTEVNQKLIPEQTLSPREPLLENTKKNQTRVRPETRTAFSTLCKAQRQDQIFPNQHSRIESCFDKEIRQGKECLAGHVVPEGSNRVIRNMSGRISSGRSCFCRTVVFFPVSSTHSMHNSLTPLGAVMSLVIIQRQPQNRSVLAMKLLSIYLWGQQSDLRRSRWQSTRSHGI